MYIETKMEREEYCGTIANTPIIYIQESYRGEAFSLFLEKTKEVGFFDESIIVKDDFSGELIEIVAEEELTQKQINYLKELDFKEKAKKMAESFNMKSANMKAHMTYEEEAS